MTEREGTVDPFVARTGPSRRRQNEFPAWASALSLGCAVGIGALGVAPGVLGKADGAPGLVLLGILLIVSACTLGVRTVQRAK